MIPKVIHQIWIGDKNIPLNVRRGIETWKKKNPECKHVLWTNDTINELMNMPMSHLYKLYDYEKKNIWNGRANLLRYEILYRYGGIYIDADSYCLETLDNQFFDVDFWSVYENEVIRPNLIANGFIGCTPKHFIMEKLRGRLAREPKIIQPSWQFSGPGLLTDIVRAYYPKAKIFPSHYFMPRHARSSERYAGSGKIYGDHYWGNSENAYDYGSSDTIYATMITGLNKREKMGKMAVDNFHEQGYDNKKLIIINDGSYRFGSSDNVEEIVVDKKHTLGQLRNLSMEPVPEGGIIMQWDDDDYRHSTLMKKQYDVYKNETCDMLTLKRQIRYSFKINSAWVHEGSKRGIHGTVMFCKIPDVKYPDEKIGEDTVFLRRYKKRGILKTWKNPPHLYLRFIHGSNTWQDEHFKLHTRVKDHWEVEKEHQEWFYSVTQKYNRIYHKNFEAVT